MDVVRLAIFCALQYSGKFDGRDIDEFDYQYMCQQRLMMDKRDSGYACI